MFQHASQGPHIHGLGLDDNFTAAPDLEAESVAGCYAQMLTNLFRNRDLTPGCEGGAGHVLTHYFLWLLTWATTLPAAALLLPNITTTDLPVAGPSVEPSMMAMPQSS
jgi:hypothetical protein